MPSEAQIEAILAEEYAMLSKYRDEHCTGLDDVKRYHFTHTSGRMNEIKVLREKFAALSSAKQPAADDGEAISAPYQSRVHDWMMACFNDQIAFSIQERNHRFLEEALELVQSLGCTQTEVHQLVDYVYGRPDGEPAQEVGGVIVCLAALCTASQIDMAAAGEVELARIWTKVEKIRAKHAAKPQFSPLPGYAPAPPRDLITKGDRNSARERAAKKAYDAYTDNHPTIHSNRFPSWDELNEDQKAEWLTKGDRNVG